MSTECQQVAKELHMWAKSMGFIPGSKFVSAEEYPSAKGFQKICKGRTIQMWLNIMKQIRPKNEVLHVQKNLLLHRLKTGESLEKYPMSGHFCKQVILSRKLEVKQNELKELLESIEKKEAIIKSNEKALRKSGHRVTELQNQLDEFNKKRLLFKIKSQECRSKLDYFKEIADVANDLCPPHPNNKPPSATLSETAEDVIYKCIDVMRDFHSKTCMPQLDVMEESQTDLLKCLWEQIKSNISGWGAQQLWEALNTKHMAELLDQISALCSDETKTIKSVKNQAAQFHILPAKLLESTLECICLETKIFIKRKELNVVKQQLIQTLLASKLNSLLLVNQNGSHSSDLIEVWVESQSERAELLGKLQGMKMELLNFKDVSVNRFHASANLKAIKDELAKLDIQVDHKKKTLERSLAQLKVAGVRLESAQAKALGEKEKLNNQVTCFLQTPKLKRSDDDSVSPPRAIPTRLTSTMIDNETINFNVTFNTSFGSIAEKFGGQSNLTDIMFQLKESVSKEAKLFIKVHLDTVPFVLLNGKRESICNLMVHAPSMTFQSANFQRKLLNVVQGTPYTCAPQIFLRQLHALMHVKAIHLYQLIHQIPYFPPLQAPFTKGALKQRTPKQEAVLQGKLEDLNASIDKIVQLLATAKNNVNLWIDRPVQEAIPNSIVVDGKTFHEWCQAYDKLCTDK